MGDKEITLVLENYPLKVRRIKLWLPDFWQVETKEQVYWLRKTSVKGSQLMFLHKLLTGLKEQGLVTYEGLLASKDGAIYQEAEEGIRFYLLEGTKGKRGKLNNSPHWQSIARFLAKFHKAQDYIQLDHIKSLQSTDADSYIDRFQDRHKELTSFQIDHQGGAGSLEKEVVISHLDYFIEQSEEALEKINSEEVEDLRVEERKAIALRQVHPANFILNKEIIEPINWEFAKKDIRIYDLGRLLKMAGYLDHWSVEKGKVILEAYQEIRPLNKAEKVLLRGDLLFPRYYWINARKLFKDNNSGDAYKRLKRTLLDEGRKVRFINELEGFLR